MCQNRNSKTNTAGYHGKQPKSKFKIYSTEIIIAGTFYWEVIQNLASQSAITTVGAEALLINGGKTLLSFTLWLQLQENLTIFAYVFLSS